MTAYISYKMYIINSMDYKKEYYSLLLCYCEYNRLLTFNP